jgi:hypothetical protein
LQKSYWLLILIKLSKKLDTNKNMFQTWRIFCFLISLSWELDYLKSFLIKRMFKFTTTESEFLEIFFVTSLNNTGIRNRLFTSESFWSENFFRHTTTLFPGGELVLRTRVTSHAPRWKAHSNEFGGAEFSRASKKQSDFESRF